MRVALVFLSVLFVGLAFGSPAPQDSVDTHEWDIGVDENGNMRLVSYRNPYQLDDERPSRRDFEPERDVRFLLYTPANAETPDVLRNGDIGSIQASHFNSSNPTRMVIHGWFGTPNSEINRLVRSALFFVGNFNVIFVDWSVGALDEFYPNSRQLVYAVGAAASNMLDYLERYAGLRKNDLVVVGHSLGAHVAGNVGKWQSGLLGTIIGLDPALPFFAGNAPDRIMDTDARYVEIIHTNGGVLGFLDPIGHADFYPNLGRIQPGCGADVGGGCAHGRAVHFYVESILSRHGFVGQQCQSFQNIRDGQCNPTGVSARMGGEPPNAAGAPEGIFFMQTANAFPFAEGC
ncbi:pancreatic lipase-related protein 2-like [Anopheles cruzii]|uniref:pancreatic lipase-related protein 2-like n=1 Tax=Anopheles cruzii TaxID=68878 RepID=UPI0022EC4068|nr:pancreatic lipase-related protein 2-like [Anopheles cruzii]